MDLTSFGGRRSGGGQIERKKRRGWSSKRKLLICQVTPFPPFSLEQWMFAQLDFFLGFGRRKHWEIRFGACLVCQISRVKGPESKTGCRQTCAVFFALLAFLSEGGLQKFGGRVRGARKNPNAWKDSAHFLMLRENVADSQISSRKKTWWGKSF